MCLLLQTDPYGRISIMQFFNYVMRKVWLYQTRIGLALYDVAGLGYLKESVRMLDTRYQRLFGSVLFKVLSHSHSGATGIFWLKCHIMNFWFEAKMTDGKNNIDIRMLKVPESKAIKIAGTRV